MDCIFKKRHTQKKMKMDLKAEYYTAALSQPVNAESSEDGQKACCRVASSPPGAGKKLHITGS